MKTQDLRERYRVGSGHGNVLPGIAPGSTDGISAHKARAVLPELVAELGTLQERLWAERRRSLLVVLQGMDTSGKDGTVKHVLGAMNPGGTEVANFKAPTPEELGHDFLWRVRKELPEAGEVTVFNRSHYEDVVAVRVWELAPESTWRPRFDRINAFEQELVGSGTRVVKLFLHISYDEQRRRLLERLRRPDKRWKFRAGDLEDRALWPDYQAAYEDALRKTSTKWAPWYVVPADRKWYRNLAIGALVVQTLEGLPLAYPAGEPGLEKVEIV